jgi:hypothetical protein
MAEMEKFVTKTAMDRIPVRPGIENINHIVKKLKKKGEK